VRSNSSLSSLGITFIEIYYDKIGHTFCLYWKFSPICSYVYVFVCRLI
jgi:hypothetical protein